VEFELRSVGPGDPAALTLLAAARAEIDGRRANAESGASTRRPVAEAMKDDREILVAARVGADSSWFG
jgi:hypothetical protein